MKFLPRVLKNKHEVYSSKGLKRDILIKIYDGFFQAGDKVVKMFDQNDEESVKNLRNILEEEYWGKEVLIMDLVDPDPVIGRHGIDIRTIRCPDGSI